MAGYLLGSGARRGNGGVGRANVAIAVAQDARDHILEVAAVCRALGFEHTSTLKDSGVLIGSVEFGDLQRLWSVPGVLAVEVEREFRFKDLLWGLGA